MPKFTPKGKKEEPKKQPVKKTEEKKAPKPTDEEVSRLAELEKKFGKIASSEKKPAKKTEKKEQKPAARDSSTVWEKMKRVEKKDEEDKDANKIAEHEARRITRPTAGMVGPDDPEYISPEKLEKRKRELAMTETKLRRLEREEQDINKRLEYLRKEHSAMEMAIKEKTHLEREIAELREDRDRIKDKLDELKQMEGNLEGKTWDELKKSPAIGAKISTFERRIHELEGQILDLKEQLYSRGGGDEVERKEPVKAEPVKKTEAKPAEKAVETKKEPKPEPAKKETKPEPVAKKGEPKQEPSKTGAQQKKKRTRLAF